MPKITLPKGQDFKTSEFQGRDGTPVKKTHFACMYEGNLLPNCEAFGDRKAQLTEAMNIGAELEIEGIPEYKEKFHVHTVKFPRGTGSEAGYRGKYGGGGGYTPAGYKGKPVSRERYLALTAEHFAYFYSHLMKAVGGDAAATPAVIESAKGLTCQYWIEVEHNVTFPEGCEPSPAAASPTDQTQAAAPPTESPEAQKARADVMDAEIAAATTLEQLQDIQERLESANFDDATASRLFKNKYNRKLEIAKARA